MLFISSCMLYYQVSNTYRQRLTTKKDKANVSRSPVDIEIPRIIDIVAETKV